MVRIRSAASERLIERVRKICLALPEATEKLSHGEPTWFAGKGKVFASIDDHHHGAPHCSVWLPQPLGVQEALVDAQPKRFFRPPYVGPSGWVGVVLTRAQQLRRNQHHHRRSRANRKQTVVLLLPKSCGARNPAHSSARSRKSTTSIFQNSKALV